MKKKAKFTKVDEFVGNLFAYTWIVTWFLAIWIRNFSVELFLTGVLSFFLALLYAISKYESLK